MDTFDAGIFEEKLLRLKDSQDSIASLSLWCLSHKEYHEKIVVTWLNTLKKVKVEHRLLLFYLANDVIQHSKRKSLPFVDSFALSLQRATKLVRDGSVRNKVMRLFKIWSERGVYEEKFLVELGNLLNRSQKDVMNADIQEFQTPVLFSKIRKCKELEEFTDLKLNTINKNHLSVTDVDKLRNSLKDKEHGDELLFEYDAGISSVKEYIKALKNEINERLRLIDSLEIAEEYYEREFEEAKVVVNAYKCFSTRVRGVSHKLEEQIKTWPSPSPVPSPDAYAPSPSPSPEPPEVPNSEPNGFFPSNEVRKINDDVTPYSPNSDLDSNDQEEPKAPELRTSSSTDNFYFDSPKPNNKRPRNSETLSNNAFNNNSFLRGTGAPVSNTLQANVNNTTTSETHQLSIAALLQTLIPSQLSAQPVLTNESPLLQTPVTKAPINKLEDSWESPESPPLFEKANYPTLADEQILNQDIDMRNVDKDDRSLIDFSDSPDPNWPIDDMDYRSAGKSNKALASSQTSDNIDNIDMDMSDDEDRQSKNKESANNRLSAVMNVSQNSEAECSRFNSLSPDGSFMKNSSKENLTKGVMHPQTVPLLSGNNVTATSAYRIDPIDYAAFGSKVINPYHSGYPDFISAAPGKASPNNNYAVDGFPSLQPSVRQFLPPPPPPPPPPQPPLWAPAYHGTPPPRSPAQFGTPPNYMQQSVFYAGLPPPVLPNPQMQIVARPYRANLGHFPCVSPRFQRW